MNQKTILAITVVIITIAIFVFFENTWQNNGPTLNLANSSPYVKEYSLQEGTGPNALLVDNRGIVWISASNSGNLLSLDPPSGTITSYVIKDDLHPETVKGNSTMVWTMVQDHDENIWFSELGMQSVWQLDPHNGAFHLFHSGTGAPFQMKVGKNQEIWFTTLRSNTIGVIEKSSNGTYKILAFDTGNNTTPAGLFLQDASVWTANIGSQNILQYKVNKENNFVKGVSMIQSIPKSNASLFSSPTDLLLADNSVWLTEHGTSFLTRYDLDNGKITRYPTSQNNFHTTTLPFWIRGTDNPKFLWFNEHQGNKIGCFNLENKTLIEYSIPSIPKNGYLTYPLNISQDPKDEKILWFSEWNTAKVGVIDGHISVPFKITANTKQIVLNSNVHDDSIDLEIQGSAYHPDRIFLNASSSITPTAELGNLTVRFSSNLIDISHDQKVRLFVHDGGVAPGNYTIGISASDGYVTKTEFLDLSILNR